MDKLEQKYNKIKIISSIKRKKIKTDIITHILAITQKQSKMFQIMQSDERGCEQYRTITFLKSFKTLNPEYRYENYVIRLKKVN